MNDTFSVGENVFALFSDRTVVAECRYEGTAHDAWHVVVEVHNDNNAIRGQYVLVASDVFRSRAAAFYAVAQKWAAVRDVAEANRARAVEQSIA